jgi:NADH:ubiquinone oxidoreductase subunit K
MDTHNTQMLISFGPFIVMLFIIGIYCILASFNLIRILIGVELLMKAVTLLLVVAGSVSKHFALSQALVITLIVIEVVVVTVAVGVVLGIWGHTRSLDAREVKNLDEGQS